MIAYTVGFKMRDKNEADGKDSRNSCVEWLVACLRRSKLKSPIMNASLLTKIVLPSNVVKHVKRSLELVRGSIYNSDY